MALRTVAVVLGCFAALSAAGQQGPRPEEFQGRFPGGPPRPRSRLALTEEAEGLLKQWEIAQAALIAQLRFLQLQYRDAGRADDAAAIAARVRQMQRPNESDEGSATAELVNEGLPTRDDPVPMPAFRQQAGQTLSFAILGRADQRVYGTAVYADDSGLETAAVHAGLIRVGQRAIVRVQMLPGEDSYEGTTRNGVQSDGYGHSAGSFRVVSVAISRPDRAAETISSFRDLVNESIILPLVGSAEERVRGDGVYSDDSSPAAAAVHTGILADGEFAWVRIFLLPGQTAYHGTPRNGVTSETGGPSEGSFRVERAAAPYIVQLLPGEDASEIINMDTLRGRPDSTFIVQTVGDANGNAWGTGVYTDDSSIATAAVHDGLLKDGETGFVRVILMPGRERYPASVSNGVRSQDYGAWKGSIRLEAAPR